MELSFNQDQAKSLSNFFFDIAKGLTLGTIGLFAALPFISALLSVTASLVFAYLCVRVGLNILE